jgi:hypothetical protein
MDNHWDTYLPDEQGNSHEYVETATRQGRYLRSDPMFRAKAYFQQGSARAPFDGVREAMNLPHLQNQRAQVLVSLTAYKSGIAPFSSFLLASAAHVTCLALTTPIKRQESPDRRQGRHMARATMRELLSLSWKLIHNAGKRKAVRTVDPLSTIGGNSERTLL